MLATVSITEMIARAVLPEAGRAQHQRLTDWRADRREAKVDEEITGPASDVAFAMELGCDGVLLNTAIASAANPLRMAVAMKQACEAGRNAVLSGRIPRKLYATASSPTEGVISRPLG